MLYTGGGLGSNARSTISPITFNPGPFHVFTFILAKGALIMEGLAQLSEERLAVFLAAMLLLLLEQQIGELVTVLPAAA